MAAATLLSRVLGMVRVMVYARFMGDGWVAGAFTFAFQIPNLFRRLLGEGALTAAFIPIFKEKEKVHGEAEMWRSANAVISGLVIFTCAVVAIGMIAATGRTTPAPSLEALIAGLGQDFGRAFGQDFGGDLNRDLTHAAASARHAA